MKTASHRIVPLVVACALFMEQIDGSIIATAVPRISEALRCPPVHLNLAITAYMFSLAVFIPLSGWFADRFGARTVFRHAIVVFIAGSIACGLSNSLNQLVLARIFQGAGGAMMVPVGRLVLLRAVPKAKLVDAMALMTAPALIGPILGPPIGGIIVTVASWHWVFLINVPIGILGYLATRYIRNYRTSSREKLDVFGFTFLAIALAGTMFVFETVGRGTISLSLICGAIAATAIVYALYWLRSLKTKNAIVDLRPMKYETFRASLVGGSLFRIVIGAIPFLLPLMLQYGFKLSPALSGFVTLSVAIGAFAMKIAAKPIIRAIGFRRLLIGNSALNAAFFAGLAFLAHVGSPEILFAYLLFGGLIHSLHFTALNIVAFADIPDYLLSRANTLYNLMQQLTLSLGVATGALMLNFALRWRDSATIEAQDFFPVYIGLAVLCLFSAVSFIPLAQNAGALLSGHRLLDENNFKP